MKKLLCTLTIILILVCVLASCNFQTGTPSESITPTIEISEDGYWIINGEKTNVKVQGDTGNQGEQGIQDEQATQGEEEEYTIVVTPPTCRTVGYTTKICSACGKSEVYDEVAMVGHTYSNYSADSSYHWKQCQFCDTIIEYTEHIQDGDGVCIICNNIIGDTDGIIYDISDDGTYAEVVGYVGAATMVKIASMYREFPVTNICKNAFKNNDNITSVIIPDSVVTIESSAFYRCDKLTNITIGKGVSLIEPDAFAYIGNDKHVYISNMAAWCSIRFGNFFSNPLSNNSSSHRGYLYLNGECITNLVIPGGVTSINNYAFYNCSNITDVTILDGVTSIGSYAFYDCSSLASVTIPNSVISIGSNAFYNCSSSLYTEYRDGRYVGNVENPYQVLDSLVTQNLGTYTIHKDTEHIAPYVFDSCAYLEIIAIPASVVSIGNSVFQNCDSLVSVTIGKSVISIGDSAFYDCDALTSINFSNSVINIGNSAFYSCDTLMNVVIPNSVTTIGNSAFAYCDALKSVTIGNSVTIIGNSAFYDCDGLTEIIIPDSVITIGNSSFAYCDILKTVTIGDFVTTIGNSAFYNCSNLTSVTIGNSVTSIGYRAFYECPKLTSTTFFNPFGWWYASDANATSGTALSADSLSNTSTAAQYLRSYPYCTYYWFRTE